MKVEIDEELWYGASSDEVAEAHAAKSMAARMGRIVGAKPFPAAAQRLATITQDPNCQMDEVVAVLESDPALSARLLRLVNSVGFSLRTACTSVRHAAALVGTEKLNQVASTAAILDMYESGGERAKELLEHATVVGTLCRYLAFHFGLPPDELFTCGFLHDIGKLMLLETEGSDYLQLLGSELPDFDKTYVEERKRYGFDHALLAGHVLAAWNIPHPVPKVVAWHHHVTRAYAESTTISQMVSTLRLADAMSFALTKVDAQVQIENIARMEAASYMDISEGQLAAMWDEVRSLTERARAVFRGEKLEDHAIVVHTSRPSGASLRAVARARNSMRSASHVSIPAVSERARQFPCVVCSAPSYAHRCSACQGYMCPLHVAKEDEWCQLCQRDYEEAGIPAIRPLVSTLFGALAGGLVAAAFFGAASAGAQRPLRIMLGPTLILMLLGMLAGVGQRWVRRWWFLRSRPSRASIVPKAVEVVLGSAAQQNPQIVEIESFETVVRSAPEAHGAGASIEPPAPSPSPDPLLLMNPEIPALPALPRLEPSNTALSTPPRSAPRSSSPPRERSWMSSRTPHPVAVSERLAAPPSDVPPVLSSPPLAQDEAPSSPPAESVDARAVPASEERPIEGRRLEDESLEPELAVAAGQSDAGMRPSGRLGSVRPAPPEPRVSNASSASLRADRASPRQRPSGAPRVGSERPVARIRPNSNAPSSARARSITPAATPSARARLAPGGAVDDLRSRRTSEPPPASSASSFAAPVSSVPPREPEAAPVALRRAAPSEPPASTPALRRAAPSEPPANAPVARESAPVMVPPAPAADASPAPAGAPQTDAGAPQPRGGWTSLLDEGTAGGW